MKALTPMVVFCALLAAGGAGAKEMSRGSNIVVSPPRVVQVTPIPPLPTVNSGTLSPLPQTTLGTPLGNPGLINPLTQGSNFGALPGEPGSSTFDPTAALPALGNAGSAITPIPGTSAAGFNNPSVTSGTNTDIGPGMTPGSGTITGSGG
jgi:hypothetical protein